MIIESCSQRDEEWFRIHLGIPTASQFGRVLTPTGELSTQAETYMYQLLAEWVTGVSEERYSNYWMERGTEIEPEARAYYTFFTGAEVQQVGFIYKDERRMTGCSPDGLIEGGIGGLEIKAPKASTHLRYLLQQNLPTQYLGQVQGSLWITGAKYWDWLSYHPEMPPVLIRILPDPVYQRKLDEAMNAFIEILLKKREEIKRILPEELQER